MSYTDVTDKDRKNFQKWLKRVGGRYRATHGIRDRPGAKRIDHGPITTGAVEIGKEIHESVPQALAALVVQGGAEDDPRAYLRPWVGSESDMDEFVVGLFERDRERLVNLAVFGLRCEHDGCHRFIRPVAVKLKDASGSFIASVVCATCQDVTVIWADEGGVWVRSAPELKGRQHPMRPEVLWRWIQKEQPPTNREARLIAP